MSCAHCKAQRTWEDEKGRLHCLECGEITEPLNQPISWQAFYQRFSSGGDL